MLHSLRTIRTCIVCMRSFPNGKALGGHMRTHAPKRSASTRSTIPTLQASNKLGANLKPLETVLVRSHAPKRSASTRSTIPTLQASNNLGANIKPLETVLVRSVHTIEVGECSKPDLKSEEEGGQQTTGKRKFLFDLNEVYSEETESSSTDEVESALCLIAMSKGERPANCESPKAIDPPLVPTRKGKEICTEKYIQVDSDSEDEDEDVKILTTNVGVLAEDSSSDEESSEEEDNDNEDDDETYLVARDAESKKRYKCDICGVVLHSYQALGGHRTSHKNKRVKTGDKNDQAVVEKLYGCEFCDKVFRSGQALGGHKKVHFAYLQPCPCPSTSVKLG